MIEDTCISKLTDILVFIHFFRFGSKIISNILAIAFPAHVGDLCVLNRVGEGPHSFIVGTVRLHEVAQMKSVSLAFSGVLYSKVIPLCKALS